MNRIRLISSGLFLIFVTYSVIWNTDLLFKLPIWVYIAATIFWGIFPIKDMLSATTRNTYKGRQFAKYYKNSNAYCETELKKTVRLNNIMAAIAFAFWLTFMDIFGGLYFSGVYGREWIVFVFARSNFSVFFAVFVWCPFYKIFIQCKCCNECRIYNWDSFFQYSFLIFIQNPYTITLFALGLLSLLEWEIMHRIHPERFYKMSNQCLTCEKCDMESCKQHKKKFFSKKLKI